MPRRIALVCIDPTAASAQYRPFNYAVRKIQAALIADRALDVEVHLVESFARDVDEFVERLEAIDPDLIGASAYVWSLPTFVAAAERLKQRRPDRTIVFGGPSARPAMLSLPPWRRAVEFIDALVLGEGEDLIRRIAALPAVGRAELAALEGVAVATRDGWRSNGDMPRVHALDALASPYQHNLVPAGVYAHLETFRGCPLACSFCQWGDAEQSTRVFSKDYLVRELEAFRRARLPGVILVDAALNLNPRAFRNLVAAEQEVGWLREASVDFEVYPSHLHDEHLKFISDIRVGRIGIGLQSYDKEVLRRLQRPFDAPRFERVVRELASMAQVTIEIIMGLPGDTRASFERTLDIARSLPGEVRVFHCLALPDALMTRLPPGLSMEFDPTSLKVTSCTGWTERDIREESERLTRLMEDAGGWSFESAWTFPGPKAPDRGHGALAGRSLSPDELDALAHGLGEASAGQWTLRTAGRDGECVSLEIETPDGRLTLDLRPGASGARAFRVVDGVAFSYRNDGAAPTPRTLRDLERVSGALGRLVRALVVREHAVRLPIARS